LLKQRLSREKFLAQNIENIGRGKKKMSSFGAMTPQTLL
jgi:hypothetical protein